MHGLLRAAQKAHWPTSIHKKDASSACKDSQAGVYIGSIHIYRTKKAPRLLGGGQVLDGRGSAACILSSTPIITPRGSRARKKSLKGQSRFRDQGKNP